MFSEKASFTLAEVADILRVDVRTIYRWHSAGLLRTVGKPMRVSREEVLRLLNPPDMNAA